jgi:tetratricopeptide (TPR) repeat protein
MSRIEPIGAQFFLIVANFFVTFVKVKMKKLIIAVALAAAVAEPAFAQIPEKFENLEVLPKDISRQELTQVMRAFAGGLGVRCQYCHVVKPGGNPNSLESLDFKSDAKVEKKKARVMMKMTRTINTTLLAELPERSQPNVAVQCVTCHRGSPLPKTLERVLAETIEKQGVDSAVAQYRQLRETALVQGRYNFGEGTLNQVAEQLVAQSKTDEAIRMLELNQEFNPRSANIDYQLGEIYRGRNEVEKAKAAYRKALEKQPNHQQAARRLQELGG